MVDGKSLWKIFGNGLPHIASLDAGAAMVLLLLSAAPAGTHQGFGVAQYQDRVTKCLPRRCVNLGCLTGC